MGPWRALMSRARGRHRYLAPSSPSPSSSLASFKAQQQQQCSLAPIARFESHSYDACASFKEGISPRLGLGFLPGSSQKSTEKKPGEKAGSLLVDAKDFLLDSSLKDGYGRLYLGFSEGSLQDVEQKKPWLSAGASAGNFLAGTLAVKKPWLNAGASLDDTKALLLGFLKQRAPRHDEGFSLRFSMCDAAIQAPGLGSEDLTIQADSVKRKRKKKMNKHKHRKLRRLARKSHK